MAYFKCAMFDGYNDPQDRKNIFTSARVKSYQLVKVLSGGRAPAKSSILASQLLVQFLYCGNF